MRIDTPIVDKIELGHATDTSITRVSAGVLAVEGVVIPTETSTNTLTNKTLTSPTLITPVLGTPSSGTLTNCTFPTLNQDTTGKSAKTDALNSATTVVNVSSATAPTAGQVLTATSSTAATWQTPSSGGAPKEIRIRIPGEMVADTANYQGVFWRNNTGASITISNVAFAVAIAAAGSGAAAAFNIYKSSGTASDGINTSAVNLFTSAVDLTTTNLSATNVPNTTTVESGRWVSLRCTSSAGATNKASDAEIIITYS